MGELGEYAHLRVPPREAAAGEPDQCGGRLLLSVSDDALEPVEQNEDALLENGDERRLLRTHDRPHLRQAVQAQAQVALITDDVSDCYSLSVRTPCIYSTIW